MRHTSPCSTVLYAGFHPLVLEDCRMRAASEYRTVAVDADETVLLPAVDRLRPDVVLVDLLYTSSLQTIQRITAIHPSTSVIALTGLRRKDVAESVLAAGASGVIQRTQVTAELRKAVETVLSGLRYLSPVLAASLGDDTRPAFVRAASDS